MSDGKQTPIEEKKEPVEQKEPMEQKEQRPPKKTQWENKKKGSLIKFFMDLPGKIIIILLLLLMIGGGIYWFGFGGAEAFESFWGRVEVTTSRSKLIEVLPKSELVTARGTFSFIFPFDFWEQGTMRELREGRTLGILSRPSPRILYLQSIFDWAQENKFSLIAPQEYFLIQTEVDLGFPTDLEEWEIKQTEEGITLTQPAAELLAFRIVERDWSQEGFPDFELPIEAWRDLLGLLDAELRERSLPKALWERADTGLNRFFRGLPGTGEWILQPSSPESE